MSLLLAILLFMGPVMANEMDDSWKPEGATQVNARELLDDLNFDPKLVPPNAAAEVDATEEMVSVVPPLVEYVIDSSGSMGGLLDEKRTKIYVLKKLLSKYLLAQWNERSASGLRVFGGKKKRDCTDNILVIPPKESKLGHIESVVKGLEPVGMTPLSKALEAASKDLKDYNGPKRIVLFTDGEETCGQDPCKMVETIKKSTADVEFFVVAFGLKDQAESVKKLKCIGDLNQADSEKELEESFEELDKKLNPNKNLFVQSPIPEATVFLFKANEPDLLFRKFEAKTGVEVPPGDYIAIVNLRPKYKFSRFTVPKKKKVVLKVAGNANFKAEFIRGLIKIELLNSKRKAVKKFKSDELVKLPMGKWTLRFYREPFFEKTVENYVVIPNADYTYIIEEAGVAVVDDPELRGVYVNGSRGVLLGNHLTNTPLVLPKGIYNIRVDEGCSFKDVIMGSNREILRLNCKSIEQGEDNAKR